MSKTNHILETESGMFFEGCPEKVLSALIEKKRLLKNDVDSSHIRPLLIVLSGIMRGADGGGRTTALEELGLTDSFDTMLGVSTGAGLIAYAASHQSELGTSIYHEECVQLPLVSITRALRGGHLADIHHMANILRYGKKSINQKKLKSSRINTIAVTTHKKTGKKKLLNLRELDDIVDGVEASFAIVGASDHVEIDGVEYIDGGLSMPFPQKEVIEEINPTHILVIANKTEGEKMLTIHRLIAKWMVRNMKHLQPDILKWQHRFDTSLKDMRDNHENIPYLIAWSGTDVFPIETNQKKLINVTKDANKHMKNLFKKYNLL